MPAVRSVAVLASALLWAVANCAPGASAAPGMDTYVDPVNGWSISYPVGWRVDGADPAVVRIHDPGNQAQVGIRVAPTGLRLNAAVDQILASQEQYLRERQLTWALTSRQLITLPNGTAAVEVRGDLLPGGRSRQLYFARRDRAFGVNAETYIPFWDKFSADFDRILQSFAAPADPPQVPGMPQPIPAGR